jgi:hypothetical protein
MDGSSERETINKFGILAGKLTMLELKLGIISDFRRRPNIKTTSEKFWALILLTAAYPGPKIAENIKI